MSELTLETRASNSKSVSLTVLEHGCLIDRFATHRSAKVQSDESSIFAIHFVHLEVIIIIPLFMLQHINFRFVYHLFWCFCIAF